MAGNPHVDEANEREFGKILTRRKAPGPMDYLQSSEVATAKSKDLRNSLFQLIESMKHE